jgi:hypothetical protein
VVDVWVDRRGGLTDAPQRHRQTVAQAWLAAVLAAIGLAALLGLGRVALCRRLARYRLDSWQREWAEIGPQWTVAR